MASEYRIKFTRFVAAIPQKEEFIFDSDEFRELVNSLDPHHHRRIYCIIIDYYFSEKVTSNKKHCKTIPYKGKSLNGKKRSLSTNILYNLDNLPENLRLLIVNYVYSRV
jgi:hypothetical protein